MIVYRLWMFEALCFLELDFDFDFFRFQYFDEQNLGFFKEMFYVFQVIKLFKHEGQAQSLYYKVIPSILILFNSFADAYFVLLLRITQNYLLILFKDRSSFA